MAEVTNLQASTEIAEHHGVAANGHVDDSLAKQPTSGSHVNDSREVSRARLTLIMVGLALSVYIVSLDSTIVAPVIPRISNDFNSLSDVTWYISVYFATSTAVQPLCGNLYAINVKWTYIAALSIFELGSLICAVAQNSHTFIVGRAIAGVGLGMGYVGTLTIVGIAAPLHLRTMCSNIIGSVYGLGAVSGPLIGGAFTTKVTWRWAFYIESITIFIILIWLRLPPRPHDKYYKTPWQHVKEIDFVGTILLLGSLIAILLALQSGGVKWAWSDGRTIASIVVSIVVGLLIIPWCFYRQELSIMPPRILKMRTMMGGCLINFAVGGAYFSIITFLAYYYQARGSSALRSGVQLLPLIAGVVFASMLEGGAAPKVGSVPPFLYFGLVCFTVAAGVLTLLDENSSTALWAGITFLTGFGAGICWQMPFIASQTVLRGGDVERGSAIIVFYQTLGGALIFAINQAIYDNKFLTGVLAIPNLPNAQVIALSGITAFRHLAPPEFIEPITVVAVKAIRDTYFAPIVLLGLAIFAVPLIEYVSIKEEPKVAATELKETKGKSVA